MPYYNVHRVCANLKAKSIPQVPNRPLYENATLLTASPGPTTTFARRLQKPATAALRLHERLEHALAGSPDTAHVFTITPATDYGNPGTSVLFQRYALGAPKFAPQTDFGFPRTSIV